MSKKKVFELRLYIDGKRVLTHNLDIQQARAALVAAKHLQAYLEREYALTESKCQNGGYPLCSEGPACGDCPKKEET